MPSELAKQFNAKTVTFNQQENLTMIEVDNAFATAKITTLGGSVLSYVPKHNNGLGADILWVSETAVYDGKKPVRGGVPVCWPWFGGHPTDKTAPAHGFVRAALWQVSQVADLANGATEVTLSFKSTEKTLALWAFEFHLELKIEIGEKLVMSMTTANLSDKPMEITEALHTYFTVADARDLVIGGLEGAVHLDKLSNAAAETQTDTVVLRPPMDSVYLNHTATAVIEDAANQRQILVEKSNASSCVVWNPGPETVKGFADIRDEDWPTFACVEAGNVLDNAIQIPAGAKHTFEMKLSSRTV